MKDSERDEISPVPRRRVGEGLAKEELGGSLEGVGLPRRSLKGGAGAEVSVGVDGEVSCESACAARDVCERVFMAACGGESEGASPWDRKTDLELSLGLTLLSPKSPSSPKMKSTSLWP